MINDNYRAAILMSAYGNSRYFSEQVQSIVNQMSIHDILIIVDDGSRAVDWISIRTLPCNYIFSTRIKNLGVSSSFIQLILELEIRAKYYHLTDQDDFWMPNKISAVGIFLERDTEKACASMHAWCLRDGQNEIGSGVIYPIPKISKAHYCFETPAPGMVMSFNQKGFELISNHSETLLIFAKKIPHDRLLGAIFSKFGELRTIPMALVHYRQHTSNLVGAPLENSFKRWTKRIINLQRAKASAIQGQNLYLILNFQNFNEATIRRNALKKIKIRAQPIDNWMMKGFLYCITILDRFKSNR